MIIYIVEGGYDYEGFNIQGVFDTKAKAETFAAELESKEHFDYVDIEEWMVS